MSCIHYKFKSSLDYNSVTFDGLHLSLGDLRKAISAQKRLKPGEFELEIKNAQTGDVYKKADELIAKNTSVIVSRVPINKSTANSTQRSWEAFKLECAKVKEKERQAVLEKQKQAQEVAAAVPASEIDKIKAVIDQSTRGFEPSSFQGRHPLAVPSDHYICKKCGKKGHFISNCPNVKPEDRIVEQRVKRTTGIPATMLTVVDDPLHPGALLTHDGQFAVPTVDVEGYRESKKDRPPFLPGENQPPEPEKKLIPKELLCHICEDLCVDAAIAPCCGTSFCDECLREELLESEDHQCPSCQESNVSPDRIVANRSMRIAVTNFLNNSGYTKAKRRRSNSASGDGGSQLAPSTARPPSPPQAITSQVGGTTPVSPSKSEHSPRRAADLARTPSPPSSHGGMEPRDYNHHRHNEKIPSMHSGGYTNTTNSSSSYQPYNTNNKPWNRYEPRYQKPYGGRNDVRGPWNPGYQGMHPRFNMSSAGPLLGPNPALHVAQVALAGLQRMGIPALPPHMASQPPFPGMGGGGGYPPGYPAPSVQPGMPHQDPAVMMKKKPVDVFESFADFTKKKSRTPELRSRSRSGSGSQPRRSYSPAKKDSRGRSPHHSRTQSRSRSRTPSFRNSRSGARTPPLSPAGSRRVRKRSRSDSIHKARSRSRESRGLSELRSISPQSLTKRSKSRSLSPLKSSVRKLSRSPRPFRSRTRTRSRSMKRSYRSRSWSRSKKGRSRSYSPRSPRRSPRRSLNRSPRSSPLRSPRRSAYTPPRSKRSLTPRRRSQSFSPKRRSPPLRSKSRSPMGKRRPAYSRSRSPPPPRKHSLSPLRKRRTPSPYKGGRPRTPPSPYQYKGPTSARDRERYHRDTDRTFSPKRSGGSNPPPPQAPPHHHAHANPNFNFPGLPPPEEYFKDNRAGYEEFVRNIYSQLGSQAPWALPPGFPQTHPGGPYPPGQPHPPQPPLGYPQQDRRPWEQNQMPPSVGPRPTSPPGRTGPHSPKYGERYRRDGGAGGGRHDLDRGRDRARRLEDRPRRGADQRDGNKRLDDARGDKRVQSKDRKISSQVKDKRGVRENDKRGRDWEKTKTHEKSRDAGKSKDSVSLERKKSPQHSSKSNDKTKKTQDRKREEKKKEEKENVESKMDVDEKPTGVGRKDNVKMEAGNSQTEAVDSNASTAPLEEASAVKKENGEGGVESGRASQAPVKAEEKKAPGKKKVGTAGVKKLKTKNTNAVDGEKKEKKIKKKKLTFGASETENKGLKKKKLKRVVDYKSEINGPSEDAEVDKMNLSEESPMKKVKLDVNIDQDGTGENLDPATDRDTVQEKRKSAAVKAETSKPVRGEEEEEEAKTATRAVLEEVVGGVVSELPQLSKWERDDDFDLPVVMMMDKTDDNKAAKEKTTLPRSVVDKAEKFLVEKPMKNSVIAASVSSSLEPSVDIPDKQRRDSAEKHKESLDKPRNGLEKHAKDAGNRKDKDISDKREDRNRAALDRPKPVHDSRRDYSDRPKDIPDRRREDGSDRPREEMDRYKEGADRYKDNPDRRRDNVDRRRDESDKYKDGFDRRKDESDRLKDNVDRRRDNSDKFKDERHRDRDESDRHKDGFDRRRGEEPDRYRDGGSDRRRDHADHRSKSPTHGKDHHRSAEGKGYRSKSPMSTKDHRSKSPSAREPRRSKSPAPSLKENRSRTPPHRKDSRSPPRPKDSRSPPRPKDNRSRSPPRPKDNRSRSPPRPKDNRSKSPAGKSRKVYMDSKKKDNSDRKGFDDFQVTVKGDKRKKGREEKATFEERPPYEEEEDSFEEDERSVVRSNSLEREVKKTSKKKGKLSDKLAGKGDFKGKAKVKISKDKSEPTKVKKRKAPKHEVEEEEDSQQQPVHKSPRDLRHKIEEKTKSQAKSQTKSPTGSGEKKLSVVDESEFVPDYEDLETSVAVGGGAESSSAPSSPEHKKEKKKKEGGEEEEEEKDDEQKETAIKHKKQKKKHKKKEKKEKHKHKKKKHKQKSKEKDE